MNRLRAITAAALLLVGCVCTLLAAAQSAEGGYFGTPTHRFQTATAALKSDEIDVGETSAYPGDPSSDVGELARLRILVRAADPTDRLFVGIGPADDVEAYLRGSAYAEFASAELDPFRASFDQVRGTASVANPIAQPFWVAISAGAGPQTLEWDKTAGPWSVVVMRLDGEPGLDVSASMGLRFGFLLPAGLAALAGGALLLGSALIARERT